MGMAILGIVLSAMATGLGAVPILFLKEVKQSLRNNLLAFASGIMIAATTFSLIPEALKTSNMLILAIGLFVGTYILNFLDIHSSKINFKPKKWNMAIDQKTFIVIMAIVLHNLPEGLSVGVSFSSGNEKLGAVIALAIGLQNAPEGLLVALYLVKQKVSRAKALLIATLTGVVEILPGLLGFSLSSKAEDIVPFGLSFAAGAMLFVIYKELIPESHEKGHERFLSYSFIVGLLSMLVMIEKFG